LIKRGDIVFLSSTGGEGSNPNTGGEPSKPSIFIKDPNTGGESSKPSIFIKDSNTGGEPSKPVIGTEKPFLNPFAPVYGQGENPTVFTTAEHGEKITC